MEEGLSLKGNGRFGGCLKKGIKEEWDSNTGGGRWLGDHEADIGDEEAASALQLAKINQIFPERS